MIQALVDGIKSVAMLPVKAVEGIASKIKDFFVGHSPPPMGPLHQIDRIKIVETIADSVKPGPAVAAMKRVASAMVLAATVSMPPAAAMAMPVMAPIARAEQFAAPRLEKLVSAQPILGPAFSIPRFAPNLAPRLPDFGSSIDHTLAATGAIPTRSVEREVAGEGALRAALMAQPHGNDASRELESLATRQRTAESPITITFAPNVTVHANVGDQADLKSAVKDVLSESGHELTQTLIRELEKRRRSSF